MNKQSEGQRWLSKSDWIGMCVMMACVAFFLCFFGMEETKANPPSSKEEGFFSFSEPWKEEKAVTVIARTLPGFEHCVDLNPTFDCLPLGFAKIIGRYHFPFTGREYVVMVWSRQGCSSHPCEAQLIVFEFTKRGSNWVLSLTDWKTIKAGEWGSASNVSVDARVIGPERYALFVRSKYMHHGIVDEILEVWCNLADQFQRVLVVKAGLNDKGYRGPEQSSDDWLAVFKVDSEGVGMFDIVASIKGVAYSRAVNEQVRFVFDGRRYEAVEELKLLKIK